MRHTTILFICDNSDLIQELDTMAKLCSPFGTSPPIASSFDLTPNCFNDDYFISADPFDFLDDLPSICGDIQKMGSDLGNSDTSSYGDSGMDLDDFDIKPEIRNTDLMWSAPPSSILSTSASSMCSDISSAAPLSAVMGNLVSNCKTDRILSQHQQQPQRPQPTVVTAKKFTNIGETVMIKQESDLEQQLETHSITNIKVQTTNIQNMPPGTSLLRKSNNQQQKKQQSRNTTAAASSMHITKRGDQLLACATTNPSAQTYNNTSLSSSSSSSLNTSNCSSQSASSLYQRPDTPHSLDDDCSTPEFRHNVDLRACVMGSNNISLTADPTNFINHVSQELQDTSKKQIDTRLISGCSLTDVLDVINSGISDATTTSQSLAVTATSTGGKLMNGGGGGGYSNCLLVNTSGSLRSTDCDSDEESMEGSSTASLLDQEIMFGAGGVSPVSSQSSNISSTHNYMQHSDHSYTRCKDGIDDISTNLETPSDSGELVKSIFFIFIYMYGSKRI